MIRMLILAGVLTALVASMASAAAPTPAVVRPFDSIRLYTEAEFTAAIKPYTDAIARNANDADAHHWLGVAYLHAFRLYKFGLAPYAGGFAARAVEMLERAVELRAEPASMFALVEAYLAVGDTDKFAALMHRLAALAQPLPPR